MNTKMGLLKLKKKKEVIIQKIEVYKHVLNLVNTKPLIWNKTKKYKEARNEEVNKEQKQRESYRNRETLYTLFIYVYL